MNGRVYDHNLGRFLSVDPFIQSPGNSQSINPYSYIMNNPLAGTDPSGYMSCTGSRIKGTSCASTGAKVIGTPGDYDRVSEIAMNNVESELSSMQNGASPTSNETRFTNVSETTEIESQASKQQDTGEDVGRVDWLAVQQCAAGYGNCGSFDIHDWVRSSDAMGLENYGEIRDVYDGLFGINGRFWNKQILANSIMPLGFAGSPLIRGLNSATVSMRTAVTSSSKLSGSSLTAKVNVGVPVEKFSGYIFKDGATHGKDHIFRSLGYGVEHSSQLAKMYQSQAAKLYSQGRFNAGEMTKYGQRIEIGINVP